MNKVYTRINWENEPSDNTPINETNLNKMDFALNEVDNRLIEQDTTKLSKVDASNDIINWTMNEDTGVITVTRRNGEKIIFDLNIEKIPVSFSLSDDGILTMVTDDGTAFTANIGAMIPILTFNNSDEISVSVSGTGINKTYSFSIKDNSITENKLQPNFLADIKVQSASASLSASNAETNAKKAQSYAVGGTGTRENEDTDNAMYYYEQSKKTDIGQISLKVDEISSNLSKLQDNVDSSDIPYSAYRKNANGDITPNAITSSPNINEVVSQINNNIGVLLQGHNEQNSNLSASNAGAHNSVYRGKYLGNALTTEQKAQISAGTFNDLYIGDYWTIGGLNYRIAAFDYWLNSGDTNCTTHHVVIVPDTCLYNAQMNTSNITTGAYVGSAMYTSNLEQAKTTINNAFGSANILSNRELLTNATTGNRATSWSWYDSTVELMNESMVYGSPVGGKAVDDSINYNVGIDKSQLPLFALEHSRITNSASWWLRDVVSESSFAFVANTGYANDGNASSSNGVRPVFGIKG